MKKFIALLFSVFLLGVFSPPDAEAFCFDTPSEIQSSFLNTPACIDAPSLTPMATFADPWSTNWAHPFSDGFYRKPLRQYDPPIYNTAYLVTATIWDYHPVIQARCYWLAPSSKAYHYGELAYFSV